MEGHGGGTHEGEHRGSLIPEVGGAGVGYTFPLANHCKPPWFQLLQTLPFLAAMSDEDAAAAKLQAMKRGRYCHFLLSPHPLPALCGSGNPFRSLALV